jgi:hypothetical protein
VLISFFGLLRPAFGLHGFVSAPLLDETNAGKPVKRVLAGRFYPKSRDHNLNQQLIYGSLPLIWV